MANCVVFGVLSDIAVLFLSLCAILLLGSHFVSYVEGHPDHVLKSIQILSQTGLLVDDGRDVLDRGENWLRGGVFKDILHDLSEDLKVGFLVLISGIECLGGEGDQFIDDFHDIFRIVPIVSIFDVDSVAFEEVEFITLPVIDLWDTGFDSFACSVSTVLRVFVHNVVKDLQGFDVYKFHELDPILEREIRVPLKKIFNIAQNVLGSVVLDLAEVELVVFEVVESD